MEYGAYAQRCANLYTVIGQRNGWRKGRNSPRGYDMLTLPTEAWDDRPHDRYLMVLHHHLSSAAALLSSCGACYDGATRPAAFSLAAGVFVDSSKASWLLEPEKSWTQRAARAHLELLANLETEMQRQPKKLESGYPNVRRKQWKIYRDQFRSAIAEIFGKRALSGKHDELSLTDEQLLTTSHLQDRFVELLSVNAAGALTEALVAAPELFIDPMVSIEVRLDVPLAVDDAVVDRAVLIAVDAWLAALDAWVRYNAWETSLVDEIARELRGDHRRALG